MFKLFHVEGVVRLKNDIQLLQEEPFRVVVLADDVFAATQLVGNKIASGEVVPTSIQGSLESVAFTRTRESTTKVNFIDPAAKGEVPAKDEDDDEIGDPETNEEIEG